MKTCLAALLTLLPSACAFSAEIDYARQIKPILKARCYSCHGVLKQESELRLDTVALMRKGGESGPAIDLKSPAKSQLLRRVLAKDDSERMPPEGEPLKPAEIKLIRQWLAEGARAPANERPETDPRKHWAFQMPQRHPPPQVKDSKWVIHPIDRFIASRREKLGIQPLPSATKATLLRRVYIDLIGIPPTRQQLHAFLHDGSPDAYERVVDTLLNSKRHGERWGRHWMDVWRYSDWYGRRKVPDVLNSYAQIWRWRDWIIRSINEDKGYDRMVMEMLAGDELDPANDQNTVATGFVLRNFYRWNYNTWMKDNVEHTGKAFLALTLNCCHCHAHKYDPITNKEYFKFRAFFEPLEVRHDRVAGEPDPGPYPKYKYGASYKPITSGMVRVMDEKLDAKTFMYTKGEARNIIPGLPPVEPGAPAIIGGDSIKVTRVKLPVESWYPGTKSYVRREEIARRQKMLTKAAALLVKAKNYLAEAESGLRQANSAYQQSKSAANKKTLIQARKKLLQARLTLRVDSTHRKLAAAEMAAVKARIHADNVRYKGHAGDKKKVGQAANRAEKMVTLRSAELALARAERAAFAKKTMDLKQSLDPSVRLNELNKASGLSKLRKAVVTAKTSLKKVADTYTLFGPQYPKFSTGRRLALAKWLASKKNPLTARVAVNHIWARHFGAAIVKSTENFGRNGDPPTHPKLLDWLATELMKGDWKMKRIHRLIVTSATYRQSSSVSPRDKRAFRIYTRMKELDRDNVLLWRYNSRRIEAEAVRDSMLQVARQLDLTMYGKEISQSLGLTNRRRSVYFDHHGEGRMQLLDLFDAADPCDCYRRSSSVRPHQALALSNSKLAVQLGRLLARSLDQELGRQLPADKFAAAAFEQVLCRAATPGELRATVAFLQQQERLFRSLAKSRKVKSRQTTRKTRKTKTANNAERPSSDPVLRAREGLVQALFSHSDFVTVR